MTVTVTLLAAAGERTEAALADLDRQLRAADIDPTFGFVFYGEIHDDLLIHEFLQERLPSVPVIGGTSAAGIISSSEVSGPDSIGVLLIEDPDGSYGVASAETGSDPYAAAVQTLRQALDQADSVGELPELIWVCQTPGHEELVVDGLRSVVGDRCPIVGGSTSSEIGDGDPRVLGAAGPVRGGLSVGVLFPSGGIGFEYQGGYEPAGPSGVITRVANEAGPSRTILEIDHRPAAEVYDEWSARVLPRHLVAEGGSVMNETVTMPLGVVVGMVEQIAAYRLIHPAMMTADEAVGTFAEVSEGDTVYFMRGDPRRLIARMGSITQSAKDDLAAPVAGGLIVFCAGCRIAAGEHSADIAHTIGSHLSGVPFLGCYTFGELGMLLDRNMHANLMLSAVLFGT